MTCPGAHHERLREDLDALAIMTGHRTVLRLDDGLRPDVARCHVAAARFFVGDAKDTETPANVETTMRLRGYLLQLLPVVRRGCAGTFAVAHPWPTNEWVARLAWLCSRLGLDPSDQGTQALAADLAVSWVALGAHPQRPGRMPS
jgi:hypothetical protein